MAETIGLTDAQARVMLDAHNAHRETYGAPALVYDERLASKAQAWANHLVRHLAEGHGVEHNTEVRTVDGLQGNTGENLAQLTGTGYTPGMYQPDHATPVNDWVAEVKDYDLIAKRARSTGDTGHFTQVVWKATTRVGCGFAMAYLPGKKLVVVWVCNYHPAGNTGQDAKNV